MFVTKRWTGRSDIVIRFWRLPVSFKFQPVGRVHSPRLRIIGGLDFLILAANSITIGDHQASDYGDFRAFLFPTNLFIIIATT